MAKKDYKKLSDDIIAACGGVDNVLSASHCMTRLRMNLKDPSVLNLEEAKKIPGVINIVVQNGEQQFVIGQDVASVYEEVTKNDIKAAGSVDDPDALKADAQNKGNFLEVKSNHFYDITGDGNPDLVAWIMGENDTSPYEGQYGMMREFGQGDRSSANYCTVDFILANTMITTSSLLGIYDLYSDTYADASGNTIREAVYVGNEDYLFKAENGYSSYATGSYGGYANVYTNKNERPGTYFAVYSFWRANMLPRLQTYVKTN